MKHLFVSMSVKQNFFVSVFVHKCLMVLNDVEYTIFKMFVTQMSNYLFVISFQLMFYETLRCSLAMPLRSRVTVWLFHEFAYLLLTGLCSVTSDMTDYSHSYQSIKLVHCGVLQRDVLSDKMVL